MRLLFDQNLSPQLVKNLSDLYPHSNHVDLLNLGTALDYTVWQFARTHDFIVVTKDADFSELSALHGFPPKIVWIRRGNCSTAIIESLLRLNFEGIETLSEDPTLGILMLF